MERPHIGTHKEEAEENTVMEGWKEKTEVNDGGIHSMQWSERIAIILPSFKSQWYCIYQSGIPWNPGGTTPQKAVGDTQADGVLNNIRAHGYIWWESIPFITCLPSH